MPISSNSSSSSNARILSLEAQEHIRNSKKLGVLELLDVLACLDVQEIHSDSSSSSVYFGQL